MYTMLRGVTAVAAMLLATSTFSESVVDASARTEVLPEASTLNAEVAPRPKTIAGIGKPVDMQRLEAFRGGTGVVVNEMRLRGVVADNTAVDVITGTNVIREGAFSNMSGIPTVVQNTGANVLIQSATIVNVQFQAP